MVAGRALTMCNLYSITTRHRCAVPGDQPIRRKLTTDARADKFSRFCCGYRRDDDFVGLAERAIIRAQIEAWFFRFDASQHQRPAASGARRPQIIDELIFGRLRHWAFIQRPRRWKSESIPHSKTGGQARNISPGAAGGRSWKTSRRPLNRKNGESQTDHFFAFSRSSPAAKQFKRHPSKSVIHRGFDNL